MLDTTPRTPQGSSCVPAPGARRLRPFVGQTAAQPAPVPHSGRSASGLVPLQQVERGGVLEIDRHAARLSRLRRGTLTRARLLAAEVQRGGFRGRWVMVTPTYRPGVDWSKRHMSALAQLMRVWFRRQGERFRYVWVAELQQRGAVHFHLLVWVPLRITLPKADKRGWWPHGMTRTEVARNAVGYLAKYASKGDVAKFPKGLRTHGGGGLELGDARELRWWMLPGYQREHVTPEDGCRRAPGGGFVADDGRWWPSMFVLVGVNAKWVRVALRSS